MCLQLTLVLLAVRRCVGQLRKPSGGLTAAVEVSPHYRTGRSAIELQGAVDSRAVHCFTGNKELTRMPAIPQQRGHFHKRRLRRCRGWPEMGSRSLPQDRSRKAPLKQWQGNSLMEIEWQRAFNGRQSPEDAAFVEDCSFSPPRFINSPVFSTPLRTTSPVFSAPF